MAFGQPPPPYNQPCQSLSSMDQDQVPGLNFTCDTPNTAAGFRYLNRLLSTPLRFLAQEYDEVTVVAHLRVHDPDQPPVWVLNPHAISEEAVIDQINSEQWA